MTMRIRNNQPQPTQQQNDTDWKAKAFVNIHMPAAGGKKGQKLAYIILKEGDEVQNAIAERLIKAKESGNPELMERALGAFFNGLVIEVNSAEKTQVDTDSFNFDDLDEALGIK